MLRDYNRPPIQIVFWTGNGSEGVASGLYFEPSLKYQYIVIDVREIDADLLIDGPDAGEAVFPILCKLRNPLAVRICAGGVRQRASLPRLDTDKNGHN